VSTANDLDKYVAGSNWKLTGNALSGVVDAEPVK
jgi:hypothetical protein